MQFKDKIAQHKHCRECGKAFVGEDRFCSDECGGSNKEVMQKKKKQLMALYVVSFVVLIIAVILVEFQ
jgi:predicted nucleic acid-binding Zn ribbon protein